VWLDRPTSVLDNPLFPDFLRRRFPAQAGGPSQRLDAPVPSDAKDVKTSAVHTSGAAAVRQNDIVERAIASAKAAAVLLETHAPPMTTTKRKRAEKTPRGSAAASTTIAKSPSPDDDDAEVIYETPPSALRRLASPTKRPKPDDASRVSLDVRQSAAAESSASSLLDLYNMM
jgi:hypothetical protein